jgi:hypothetical protein
MAAYENFMTVLCCLSDMPFLPGMDPRRSGTGETLDGRLLLPLRSCWEPADGSLEACWSA